MSENNMILLGVLGGVGVAVAGLALNNRIDNMERTLDSITHSISSISGNVDLTVPEDIVKLAMTQAAEKATSKAANSAIASIKDNISKDIERRVNTTINDAYKGLESELKSKLLEQVNMQSLERIENSVSEKVSKQVIKSFVNKMITGNSGSTKTDVIKTMTENGYSAYEISQVLSKIGD